MEVESFRDWGYIEDDDSKGEWGNLWTPDLLDLFHQVLPFDSRYAEKGGPNVALGAIHDLDTVHDGVLYRVS